MEEDLLLPFFSEFGPIAELTIIRDKTNHSHKGMNITLLDFQLLSFSKR
jgi:hypothetical protein